MTARARPGSRDAEEGLRPPLCIVNNWADPVNFWFTHRHELSRIYKLFTIAVQPKTTSTTPFGQSGDFQIKTARILMLALFASGS
jgi:hypothetical protein